MHRDLQEAGLERTSYRAGAGAAVHRQIKLYIGRSHFSGVSAFSCSVVAAPATSATESSPIPVFIDTWSSIVRHPWLFKVLSEGKSEVKILAAARIVSNCLNVIMTRAIISINCNNMTNSNINIRS